MTRAPEPGGNEEFPGQSSLSAEDRRQVLRAASLRPINLLMLVLGALAAVLFSWWFVPLTIVTYTLLVFLAARDPFFKTQVLEERGSSAPSQPALDISPERRARWLPRGETRQRVEEALGVYRKAVTSIEESGDVARSVLEDAVPKLHATANRLVDVGTNREKAATVIAELKSLTDIRENHASAIEKLEKEVRIADAEISETYDQLVELRAKVAQVSIADGAENRAVAAEMNASLDELNLRLEALEETMTSYEEPLALPEDQPEQEPRS